ncbi:guanine-1-methyltransferase-domain-containing protein [Delphinella strobiligena]|nr:guanine-1-methyltransferase-domain-containing protein [Delphinella strobiligena]
MEESERPNKRSKTSHERDEVSIPIAAPPATTSQVAVPQESIQQQQTDSSSITTGAMQTAHSTITAKKEADEASKAPIHALLNPLPTTTTTSPQDAATPTKTSSSTMGDSETPVTASHAPTADVESNTLNTNTTNGTGWTGVQVTPGVPLSKNQQKKLRRQEKWDVKKAQRKAERKDKDKARKLAKREARGPVDNEAWKAQQRAYVPPTQLPITLVLDCSYDELMKDNERISLAGQITRSYSENKNARFRSHLAVSSFQGKLRERFDGVLTKNYTNWKGTHFLDDDFTHAAEQAKTWMSDPKTGGKLASVFEKYNNQGEDSVAKAKEEAEIIYLSSDATHTLTELKPYSTYIIGGLVDKNREKGVCHKKAVQKGMKTARLPIGDYLDMASRKVLATNHVVEIMLSWLELGDWGQAFMKVIPKRKGGKLKNAKGENVDPEDEEDYDDRVEDEGGDEEDRSFDEDDMEKDVEVKQEGSETIVSETQVKQEESASAETTAV